MDSKKFSEILALLKNSGGKYIIIEENEPAYVLMNMNEYKKIISNSGKVAIEDMSREELIEKINQDIAFWHASQNEDEKSVDDHFLSNDSADNSANEEAKYLYEELENDF